MKRLIGISEIIGGLLLMVVPRYVLPACEYAGFSRMHCSDTAEAEMIVGGMLALTGLLTLAIRRTGPLAGVALGLVFVVTSLFLPRIFGYCLSSKMPCNYGMVPGIRFISVLTGLIITIAVILAVKEQRKKGNA